MLLLDTHAWIWTLTGDVRRVGSRSRRLISREEAVEGVRLSPATLFEVVALHTAGRLALTAPPERWIRESLDRPGIRLAELSPSIAIDAGSIPRSAIADPLDRLLVATARDLDATFMTGDSEILAYAARTRQVRVHDIAR